MSAEPATLITITPGPTRQELIAEAYRHAAEVAPSCPPSQGQPHPEVQRMRDDILVLQGPGAGLCPGHSSRNDIDTWLGVEGVCCIEGLAEGIRVGRLLVTNPAALDDIAVEAAERLDRVNAAYVRTAVHERVNQIANRLVDDLVTITANGGEPAARLRDALRALAETGDESRLRLVGSLGA